MKKWPVVVGVSCAICVLAIQSVAQQAAEQRPEVRDRRPNTAGGEGARPEVGREGGGPSRFEGGGPGPGRPERPRLPDGVTPEMIRRYLNETRGQVGGGGAQLDAMRNYLDVFDRYSRLSRDPTAAGVSAVVTAGEILRARGADTAIAYFNKVMPDVKNESVQRAIRLQLVELYKASGQQDKALEHLQNLMTNAPAGGTMGAAEGDAGGRPRPQQ